MFGKMMNRYYYGKSGKGDFRKEDLPENRWQLFWDVLRTRFSALCRLNLIYMLVWLPTIIIAARSLIGFYVTLNNMMAARDGTLQQRIEEQAGTENPATYTEEDIERFKTMDVGEMETSLIFTTLLYLIPCIAITGPFTAGVSYVTRNWARDEHAFIWSDFKDAVKENWKQGLVVSLITSVIPLLVYMGWRFYGQMARTQTFMIVPQILVMMLALVWAICVTYFYPLMVTYELKLKDVLRNGLLLGVARLPMSIGIRLLHCVPVILGAVMYLFWNPLYAVLIIAGYYILIGFTLSRFVTASWTNAVFDRYLNSRIEGAEVGRGLRKETDEEDEEEETPGGES